MATRSLIVPFHNVELYVGDLLATLPAAVPRDTEIVFVDDCSTDATADLLIEGIDGFPRAVVVRNDSNLGLAASRNRALDMVTGEHVFFVDADDWLAPGYVTVISRALEDLDVDFVRIDQVRCYDTRRQVVSPPAPVCGMRLSPRDVILPADRGTMVDFPYAHSGGFHRRLLDRGLLHFHDELRTAEDRPWIWRLHLEADSFAQLRFPGYFYRRNVGTSLTNIGDDRQLDFIPSYHRTLDVVLADSESQRWLLKVTRQFLGVADHHLRMEDRLSDGDRHRMRGGIASVLERIPSTVVDEAISASSGGRARRIKKVLRTERRSASSSRRTPAA